MVTSIISLSSPGLWNVSVHFYHTSQTCSVKQNLMSANEMLHLLSGHLSVTKVFTFVVLFKNLIKSNQLLHHYSPRWLTEQWPNLSSTHQVNLLRGRRAYRLAVKSIVQPLSTVVNLQKCCQALESTQWLLDMLGRPAQQICSVIAW